MSTEGSGSGSGGDGDLVLNFKDLLRKLDARNRDQLSERVNNYLELDAWVPPPREQDAGSLLVRIHNGGVSLDYPFALSELWETLDRVEQEIEALWTLEELHEYVNLRVTDPDDAARIIKYLEHFFPFDQVRIDPGNSATSEDGYSNRLLVRDSTCKGSPSVARVVHRRGVQLRLSDNDVRDVIDRIRLYSTDRSRQFSVECGLESTASVRLAIKLTDRALAKRRSESAH